MLHIQYIITVARINGETIKCTTNSFIGHYIFLKENVLKENVTRTPLTVDIYVNIHAVEV